jgi:hypothetical protein
MHDEYLQETLTRIHNEKLTFSSSRGDWLVHGNIHLKKVFPSQTKITAPPSKKRVEAANRLSKGFSVEDRDISVHKSTERDEHTGYGGPAKRRVRQKCEEKLISKTQLLIRPITLQLENESSSNIVANRGDRCYVDFNGRKIRY